jgi:hypothetical protein
MQRPVRDLPRIWWQPLTWIWLRRIPVPRTGQTKQEQHSKKSSQTPHQREKCKNKRKKRDQEEETKAEWLKETDAERQEDCLRIRHRLLHQSWIMYDFQYGISLDELVSRFDPIKQFVAVKTLSSSTFLSKKSRKNERMAMQSLLIAAHMLSKPSETNQSPLGQDKDENLDVATLTPNRSVYFKNRPGQLPIIIDTGCSKSLTPDMNDFAGPIKKAQVNELNGLSHTIKVAGIGWVEWSLCVKESDSSYFVPLEAV